MRARQPRPVATTCTEFAAAATSSGGCASAAASGVPDSKLLETLKLLLAGAYQWLDSSTLKGCGPNEGTTKLLTTCIAGVPHPQSHQQSLMHPHP